jgi:flagellar hook-basal body complex protein FliE
MDIKLKPFDFAQAAARAGMPQIADRVRASTDASSVTGPTGAAGFSKVFTQALQSVSASQKLAEQQQREVALDNPTVSIEQTMVSMQRAQIGFQAAMQVRNRMVQAYSEIMNMQV